MSSDEGLSIGGFELPEDPHARSMMVFTLLKRMGEEAIDTLKNKGMSADSLLRVAAQHNLLDLMGILVEIHGASVNAMVPQGGYTDTALIAAAENGAAPAVEWLLEHGANVDQESQSAQRGSCSPLWTACESGYIRVARLLLDRGANVNTYKGNTGNTALYIAAQNGQEALCAELIRHGANVDLVVGRGSPPIMTAVASNRPAVIALLRSVGAKVVPGCFVLLSDMERLGKTRDGLDRKLGNEDLRIIKNLLSADGVEKLLSIVNGPYSSAREFERKGEYRKALQQIALAENTLQQKIGPPNDRSAMWTQLRMDEQRLVSAVYGVPGSDGRVSVWQRHVFFESDLQPPPLQFYAWARHEDTIYRHGGLNFLKQEQLPSREVLWAFNIKQKQWKEVKTTGSSPGPRSGHVGVVYKDSFYVFSGNGVDEKTDSRLYRLDLSLFEWKIVKVKGQRPLPREGASSVVYRDKLYIYGGAGEGQYENDLWCYSFETKKWKELSSRGGTPRYDHGMWAARDRIFIFGGENKREDAPVNTIGIRTRKTLQAFEVFDLETKRWQTLRCAGDDPFELMEFTVLPLSHDGNEPSAIIVWGGYRHHDPSQSDNGRMSKEMQERYGDKAREMALPYRRQLLRFDLDTWVWTLLKPLCDMEVLPTAQSFAAELSTKDGVTRMLIGGGYGVIADSEQMKMRGHIDPLYLDGINPENMINPLPRNDVFEVEILDERGLCFAERAATGTGWEWTLFDSPGFLLPSQDCSIVPRSPTLYRVLRVSDEDFRDPLQFNVPENNEKAVLGHRVVLQGLKARPELNGAKGRAGFWLSNGRYQVFVPKGEQGGPATLSVKPANMAYAPRLSEDDVKNAVTRSQGALRTPVVTASWLRPKHGNATPLDYVSASQGYDYKNGIYCMDQYRGPLSARADAVLQAVCEKMQGSSGTQLALMHMPSNFAREKGTLGDQQKREKIDQMTRYEGFVSRMRQEDKARASSWLTKLISCRNEDEWGEWLTVKVTIDGVSPPVERVLLVAPDVTMNRLHQQVLCPAIGWTPNFHSYAFRQIRPFRVGEDSSGDDDFGCWIGPRTSTSLDVFFQPLFIGGAVADDRKVFLGDLFVPDEGSQVMLQYVHDFGDWWSHTIVLSRPTIPPPKDVLVAHLLSGTGCCPPEDSNGVIGYTETMQKLTGVVSITPQDIYEDDEIDKAPFVAGRVDPSRALWWRLLNGELRNKTNSRGFGSPLEFDLEAHRYELAQSLRRLLDRPGTEHKQMMSMDFSSGLFGHAGGTDQTSKKEAKPTEVCAVCGVTAALKLCMGCQSVSYCSRDHQLAHWSSHKAACKTAQKRAKAARK